MSSVDPREDPGVQTKAGATGSEAPTERLPRVSRISQTLLLVGILGVSGLYAQGGEDGADAAEASSGEQPGLEPLDAALPVEINDRVRRWIQRFRTDLRPEFERLREREGVYAEMIQAKLRERGLPPELLYLAVMESGLSPWAVSRASAVGVWQFMGPTAEQYGLRVDAWVDERRDPERATDAALDYLEHLRDRFGSWYLAAAAYNAGPGRIERVLNRHAEGRRGEEELYWEVWAHLPFETREYVPRLLAATHLAQNADLYGFQVEAADAYAYDRVFVPGGTSLSRVARALGSDVRTLRDLNPHLIRAATPPGELYPVRVPVGTAPEVVASLGRVGPPVMVADD